jgi:outer membrane protein assembly factor BamB
MIHRIPPIAAAAFAAVLASALLSADSAPSTSLAGSWPQWRGPLGTGESPEGKPPVEWSEQKNVRWKVDVPGRGHSSPIVAKDLVIVTTAVPKGGVAAPAPIATASAPGAAAAAPPPGQGRPPIVKPDVPQEFVVLALGRADGKVRWRRVVRELMPHEGTHQDGSYASGSALTDGERIYAFFGSRGLYALDFTGKVLWELDLGTMSTRNAFGEGSSPVVFGNILVVTWDHEGKDFVVGIDKKTGKELWRNSDRDEPTSWATPLVVQSEGKPQVVVNATNKVRSYDLESGKQIWEVGGMTANVIPSPVSANGVVYVTSGFRGSAALAIRLAGAKGDLTGTPAIAWSYDRDTPYVPSPLLYQDGLYFLKSNSAVLTRLDTATGKPSYTERLEGLSNVYASPVAAGGRVYVTSREGVTAVVEAGPQAKVLARNTLADGIDASPAIAGSEMYIRSYRHVYRISLD